MVQGRNKKSGTNVYISEHLTKSASDLFFEARKLLRDKKLYVAWTHHGQVLIKFSSDGQVLIKFSLAYAYGFVILRLILYFIVQMYFAHLPCVMHIVKGRYFMQLLNLLLYRMQLEMILYFLNV